MKKAILNSLAAVALAIAASSCGNDAQTSPACPYLSQATVDSISYNLGQYVGVQQYNQLTSQDVNKKDFMRGFQDAMKHFDNADYMKGVAFAAQMHGQLFSAGPDMWDLEISRGRFLEGLKSVIFQDSLKENVATNVQLQYQSLMTTLKNAHDKYVMEVAKKNRAEGQKFIDSLRVAGKSIKTTSTGVSYTIVKPGDKARVGVNDQVMANIKMTTADGRDLNSPTQTIPVTTSVISPGMQEGLKYIGKGGKIIIYEYAPEQLQPGVSVKPGQLIINEFEIVDIQPIPEGKAPKATAPAQQATADAAEATVAEAQSAN